ncbi:MAG TPA: kelch repeat-containing protein [Candidatus Thermoplasmatota archaeon]|jgi:hypothetical protein|nr:kelch repeat-containing protein [Candidatus Thermoplasmatota archaeon]
MPRLLPALLALALLLPLAAAEVLPVQWDLRAPLPTERTDIGAASLQGSIYVVGGSAPGPDDLGTRVDAYRVSVNFWDTAPPLPVALHKPVVLGVGYEVLVLGGHVLVPGDNLQLPDVLPTSETWRLDTSLPENQQVWVPWVPLPMPLTRAAGATDGFTQVWLFGGEQALGQVSAKAWRMPVIQGRPTGVWIPLPDMPEARTRAAAAMVGNGEVWVAGGEDGNLNAKASVDVLDITTNTWHSAPPMQQAREDLALVNGIGDLYALGGRSPTFPLDSVEVFDREAGAWTSVAPMPRASWGMAGASYLSDVFLVGGHDDVGDPSDLTQQLHVVTNLP